MKAILIRMIDIITGLVVIFLSLRLILKLFAANPNAGFVSWVYSTTRPLLQPFSGMFPSPAIEAGFILEFSTLFAIFIYVLVAWLLKELILFIADVARKGERKQ